MSLDFASGLALLTPSVLLYIALGAVVCSVITLIPGTSGSFALAILLPVAYTAPTNEALAMLVSVASVTGTANTLTGVLFGIPSTAAGVAVTFDGYPLTRRGEGVRAVTAGLFSALIGGILGAVALAVLLPITQPLVLAVGTGEFFALILLALAIIAAVGRQDTNKALISGGLGIMLSLVGQQASTGVVRFTGGSLYLFNGLPLIPVLIGLFALTEMLKLAARPERALGGTTSGPLAFGQVRRGLLDVVVHWPILALGSIVGVIVGLIPGLGSTAAQFISYGQAARFAKNGANFGKGAIEGVIAADAATNSKEGGALLPTLVFGIPGSESAAILLTALVTVGIAPGPTFYQQHSDLLWMFVFVLVISHVVATLFVMTLIKPIQLLTRMRVGLTMPIILAIALWGAFSTDSSVGDIVLVLVFGVVGYVMELGGYSRANLIIGLVLGTLLEQNYNLATQIYGLSFLDRPLVAVLLALTILIPLSTVVQPWKRLRKPTSPSTHLAVAGEPADGWPEVAASVGPPLDGGEERQRRE